MDTRAVLDHHLAAFRAGDVEEIMEDYSEESVMLMHDGEIRGLEALRAAFTEFFSGEFEAGTYDFSLDALKVEGDVAYIVWHASTEAADYPVGSDTFVIRDGTIMTQTAVFKVDPK